MLTPVILLVGHPRRLLHADRGRRRSPCSTPSCLAIVRLPRLALARTCRESSSHVARTHRHDPVHRRHRRSWRPGCSPSMGCRCRSPSCLGHVAVGPTGGHGDDLRLPRRRRHVHGRDRGDVHPDPGAAAGRGDRSVSIPMHFLVVMVITLTLGLRHAAGRRLPVRRRPGGEHEHRTRRQGVDAAVLRPRRLDPGDDRVPATHLRSAADPRLPLISTQETTMFLGKEIRLNRLLNQRTGRLMAVMLDHPITRDVMPGLVDIRSHHGEGRGRAARCHHDAQGHRREGVRSACARRRRPCVADPQIDRLLRDVPSPLRHAGRRGLRGRALRRRRHRGRRHRRRPRAGAAAVASRSHLRRGGVGRHAARRPHVPQGFDDQESKRRRSRRLRGSRRRRTRRRRDQDASGPARPNPSRR